VRLLAASAFGASTESETVYETVDCSGTGSCVCAKGQTSCTVPTIARVPDLPPDQRFYAGGSGTVRGYRYQAVGPEFEDGNPVGGTAMDAVNVEFRQRVGTNWGFAVFTDAGNVSEKLTPFNGLLHGGRCSSSNPPQAAGEAAVSEASCWAVGVGSGVRYYTPIGVLRLDFAVPTFRRSNDDRFEVYIGLGQAF
jgi:translocation and assembly module TamA